MNLADKLNETCRKHNIYDTKHIIPEIDTLLKRVGSNMLKVSKDMCELLVQDYSAFVEVSQRLMSGSNALFIFDESYKKPLDLKLKIFRLCDKQMKAPKEYCDWNLLPNNLAHNYCDWLLAGFPNSEVLIRQLIHFSPNDYSQLFYLKSVGIPSNMIMEWKDKLDILTYTTRLSQLNNIQLSSLQLDIIKQFADYKNLPYVAYIVFRNKNNQTLTNIKNFLSSPAFNELQKDLPNIQEGYSSYTDYLNIYKRLFPNLENDFYKNSIPLTYKNYTHNDRYNIDTALVMYDVVINSTGGFDYNSLKQSFDLLTYHSSKSTQIIHLLLSIENITYLLSISANNIDTLINRLETKQKLKTMNLKYFSSFISPDMSLYNVLDGITTSSMSTIHGLTEEQLKTIQDEITNLKLQNATKKRSRVDVTLDPNKWNKN